MVISNNHCTPLNTGWILNGDTGKTVSLPFCTDGTGANDKGTTLSRKINLTGGKRYCLIFEDMSVPLSVIMNSKPVVHTEYGGAPLICDITGYSADGENAIEMHTDICGTISGNVCLKEYNEIFITDTPALSNGVRIDFRRADAQMLQAQLTVNVFNGGNTEKVVTMKYSLVSQNGETVIENSKDKWIPAGTSRDIITSVSLLEPEMWSIDAPRLYTLEIELLESGITLERLQKRVAVRTIEARNGFIYINGELIKLSVFFRTENNIRYRTGSDKAIFREIVKLKNAGFNSVLIETAYGRDSLLDACDRLGMLVIPTVNIAGAGDCSRLFDEVLSTADFHAAAGIYKIDADNTEMLSDGCRSFKQSAPDAVICADAGKVLSDSGDSVDFVTALKDNTEKSGKPVLACCRGKLDRIIQMHNSNLANLSCCGEIIDAPVFNKDFLPENLFYFWRSQNERKVKKSIYFYKHDNEITVFSSCDAVELFINGAFIQSKRAELGCAGENGCYMQFPPVSFTGIPSDYVEIKVIGKCADKSVCEYKINAPLKAEKIKLVLDDCGCHVGNNGDIAYVHAYGVDKYGTVVPDVSGDVDFTVGTDTILCSPDRSAFENGVATAYLKRSDNPFVLKIYASSENLQNDGIEQILHREFA